MTDRVRLAELWHERARLSRTDVIGSDDEKLRPIGSASQADVAVPGMVGKNYEKGGLVILSINPAGGKDGFRPTAGDAKLYDTAKAIALSPDIEAFEAMNMAYCAGMPSWGAQWRHINAITSATKRSLSQLAYPYLVPFRTRGDLGSALKSGVVDRGYSTGFVQIMKALEPSLVIPVDRHSEAAALRLKKEEGMAFDCIYYTRQQNAHSARAETLEIIRAHPFTGSN